MASGGPTDQVQVTKGLNDLGEPWWPCPDGTVQKCELVAFKIYCKCVPKDGAGLTGPSMSAPAHSATATAYSATVKVTPSPGW